MKETKLKIIDEIVTEIQSKNILSEVVCISLTKEGLEELKLNYSKEFENELLQSGRPVSIRDLEDYFGVPLVVSHIKDEGKKYQLLTKI